MNSNYYYANYFEPDYYSDLYQQPVAAPTTYSRLIVPNDNEINRNRTTTMNSYTTTRLVPQQTISDRVQNLRQDVIIDYDDYFNRNDIKRKTGLKKSKSKTSLYSSGGQTVNHTYCCCNNKVIKRSSFANTMNQTEANNNDKAYKIVTSFLYYPTNQQASNFGDSRTVSVSRSINDEQLYSTPSYFLITPEQYARYANFIYKSYQMMRQKPDWSVIQRKYPYSETGFLNVPDSWRDFFLLLDVNRDGKISRRELEAFFRVICQIKPDEMNSETAIIRINQILSKYDFDRDDALNKYEFLCAMEAESDPIRRLFL